ncbi:MAG: cyclic nucleotide-binding domain-containing protein [Spirochaetales bacterium]|nr:cyclic nucleotide-binding domain-containing protein [Spirochaetales bacterium]
MRKEENQQYLDDLKKVVFFKVLSEEERKTLLKLSEIYRYDEHERIISEGEIQPYIFAVIKGTVNVIVREKDGREVFISSIGEGEVFGEAGIFLKVKRTANIVSTENTIILRVKRDHMHAFIKKYKDSGIKILMLIIFSLLKKLREANQEIAYERKSDVTQEDIDTIIKEFVY